MCGIVGFKKRAGSIDEDLLLSMRDSFVYRGPDDAGLWVDQESLIGLGHRRLSIIDTSASGHQPMVDQHHNNVIAFNGEVFNYIEIRQELEKLGHSFLTGTDTEVILKSYAVYGENCVDHFNGMFAIAIWDAEQQQLFIARDRLGIKPFYYALTDSGDFYFASEVKALRKASDIDRELQLELIDQYMSFGYIPGEHTLEKGIKRLLPAHKAVVKNGVISTNKYWDLDFDNKEDMGFEYYLESSKTLLNSAIDLRLRSDVSLGVFLSGGLDSSAVVGLLAERTSEPLKTFSVAYDFGKDFNETEHARKVSKLFGTDHHELFVTPEQFKDFIPKFTHLMDEPVTESAAISLQFLSQLTKQDATVVLSGEGSDEIFGGYDLYKYMTMIERYRNTVGAPLAGFIGRCSASLLAENSKIAKYIKFSAQPLERRYKGISTYENRYKEALYRPEFKKLLAASNYSQASDFLSHLFATTKDKDVLSRMLYFDTKTWLVDDLLIKADRMSMAASLELRVPFLDYRLVEFASKIPSKYKVKNGEGKYILKKMMEGILPNDIIFRKKMGFPTPLKLMFQGDLSKYARDTLTSGTAYLHDFFDKAQIERLLEEHTEGKHDHHRALWQLIVLEEWLQGYRRNS